MNHFHLYGPVFPAPASSLSVLYRLGVLYAPLALDNVRRSGVVT